MKKFLIWSILISICSLPNAYAQGSNRNNQSAPQQSVQEEMKSSNDNDPSCVKDERSMTGYICKGAAKPMMKGEGGAYDPMEQIRKGKQKSTPQ